jgi:hypothetical protein
MIRAVDARRLRLFSETVVLPSARNQHPTCSQGDRIGLQGMVRTKDDVGEIGVVMRDSLMREIRL